MQIIKGNQDDVWNAISLLHGFKAINSVFKSIKIYRRRSGGNSYKVKCTNQKKLLDTGPRRNTGVMP